MCALIGLAIPLFDHMYLQCILKKWHVPLFLGGQAREVLEGKWKRQNVISCDIM